MSNPYERYYLQQAGNGLPSFHGVRYQRGNGWFRNLFSRFGVPLLKYLGKEAVSTGKEILTDVAEGAPVKEAVKRRVTLKGRSIASDALDKAKSYVQSGSGKRRKKKKKTKKKGKKRSKKKRPRAKKETKEKEKSNKIKRKKTTSPVTVEAKRRKVDLFD